MITGAASGIGRALAELHLREGYEVVGIDRDEVNTAGQISWLQANLAEQAGLKHVVEHLIDGPLIDVFIHSAGINAVGAFSHSDLSNQRAVLEVNLNAPLLLTAQLLRHNLLKRGSSLVFISSLSHFVGYPGAAVYAASKTGLAAYARSLSVALAPRGIHVLSVYPGPTRTPHAAKYSPDPSNKRLESRRMPPEVLADKIFCAVRAKRPILVPSLSHKVMALAGRLAPGVTGAVMRRTILDRLS